MDLDHRRGGSARERILAVASELFYEEGLKVGIDTIISRSGVAKATLYHHFPSKERLVLEVLDRRDLAWRAALDEAVASSGGTPEQCLLAVFDALGAEFARADYRGSVFINAAAEVTDGDHAAHDACRRHCAAVRSRLAALATEAGAADPLRLAGDLMLLVDGAVVARTVQGDRQAAERARRVARHLLATDAAVAR